MAKKVKRRLADDIRASLREAIDRAAGRRTKVVVHLMAPRAREKPSGGLKRPL
jgi:hypothetical protein